MNRKEESVKKLQEECKKRSIGFMTSWTKMALIKRLEDEDERDVEIKELRGMLKQKEESHKHQIQLTEKKIKEPLTQAQIRLKEQQGLLEDYNRKIQEIMDEKFTLMGKRKKVLHEVEQLDILIKSLI